MEKVIDLKKQSVAELKNELEALEKEQVNMMIQRGSKQPIRPHLIKQVRRQIARINTILTEKEKES